MKGLVLLLITLGLAKSLPLGTNHTEVKLDEEKRGIEEGIYIFENVETKRILFQTGPAIKGKRGAEGGWKQAPAVVGADDNYDSRAQWKIIPQGGDKYFIENLVTQRYLFQSGPVIKGKRGAEGGWKASSGFQAPAVLGTDANYYNRAYWKFIPQDRRIYLIENVHTKRYVFQEGPKLEGRRGAEGGWLASSGFKAPAVVGTDDNYDNRAQWKLYKL